MKDWEHGGLKTLIEPDTHFTLFTPHSVNFRGTDLMLTVVCSSCSGWLGLDEHEACPCGAVTLPPDLTGQLTWATAGEWMDKFLSARGDPLEAALTGAAFTDTMVLLREELQAMAAKSLRKLMERSVREVPRVDVDS